MKKIKKQFPALPGVYIFKNALHDIIYIGKAKSLKDRIASYFAPHSSTLKIELLLEEYTDIDYIITQSETDALLLETELIQKHKPRFNVLLKEGQPFLYILFTKKPIPLMRLVRTKKIKGVYFGPFLQKQHARKAFNFLEKTFKLRVCNKKLANGCLEYHLGLCAGTCLPNFDITDYTLNINLAQHVLGKNRELFLKMLKENIAEYNKKLEFEKSQKFTEYMHNLEQIFMVIESHYSQGKYHDDIFYVTEKRPLVTYSSEQSALDLAHLIGYSHAITTIDCFDISHFQGISIVGSCVRFARGVPEKNKFRRFIIKSLEGQNDYAALQEIVQRRYAKDTQDIPDLVLIDGGKGQLSAVQSILPHAHLAALAKKEETIYTQHNKEGIILDLQTEAGRLLIALRDYAHHFAISYHRLKRKKEIR